MAKFIGIPAENSFEHGREAIRRLNEIFNYDDVAGITIIVHMEDTDVDVDMELKISPAILFSTVDLDKIRAAVDQPQYRVQNPEDN